jgi:16S rRNA processing protein RimM
LGHEDRLVPVGRVGRPHGLDGAFVVEHASDDERRWRVGATLLVDGAPATITIVRRVGGGRRAIAVDRPVVRGAELSIRMSDLPPAGPDSYYTFELVGLLAVDEDGAGVGRVVAVHPGLANDNLELSDGMLVPLIEDAVRAIDVEGGTIVLARGFLS